jgi:hypothetical protein
MGGLENILIPHFGIVFAGHKSAAWVATVGG